MSYTLTLSPGNLSLPVDDGENLLNALRRTGRIPDTPCGGDGRCGKCRVIVNGQPELACTYRIHGDVTVTLTVSESRDVILTDAPSAFRLSEQRDGCLLAFDLGTTTLVAYLMEGHSGGLLSCRGCLNPQKSFGADVLHRLQAAAHGHSAALQDLLRSAMEELFRALCADTNTAPQEIVTVSVVGNPAMQQLFLGLDTSNLITPPFPPRLTHASIRPAGELFPALSAAQLLTVPDISGYIGADTLACVLVSGLNRLPGTSLLVDIGTNGEMVLCRNGRMVACSTAAGPALEGADIQFGMRAAPGAVDHVSIENGTLQYHVLDGGSAAGICGSGLVDAAACARKLGLIDRRGRILSPETRNGQRFLPLTDSIYLTQDDLRQLQTAKAAICAGVDILQGTLGADRIDRVLLAGAFGSFLDAENLCCIGLLPPELRGRIQSLGNAAGSGACLLARSPELLAETETLAADIRPVELGSCKEFPRLFARRMFFPECGGKDY